MKDDENRSTRHPWRARKPLNACNYLKEYDIIIVKSDKKGICVMNSKIVAFIEKDIESGSYVAFVPGIPGAHTQADTLDELQIRLKEVIELCLEEMDPEDRKALPEFVGVQQIEVAV